MLKQENDSFLSHPHQQTKMIRDTAALQDTMVHEFAVQQHRIKALNTTTQENTAVKQRDVEKVFPKILNA